MADKKTILVVEDDENLRETLKYRLTSEGYNTLAAADGEQAVALAKSGNPDVVLLDMMLPKMDGLEVCRTLRRESSVPILMLTARDSELDKVVGLEVGADDYVTKPFSMRELLARIKALLRRAPRTDTASLGGLPMPLISGDLTVDADRHQAWIGKRVLDLKPREFELLAFFMRHQGRAVTRDQLLDSVWGYEVEVDTRTVDVHVRWLREKIENDPSHPVRIATIRGVGYRFEG